MGRYKFDVGMNYNSSKIMGELRKFFIEKQDIECVIWGSHSKNGVVTAYGNFGFKDGKDVPKMIAEKLRELLENNEITIFDRDADEVVYCTKAWTNRGDANPLEHGGLWVLSDERTNGSSYKGCYYVEEVNLVPDMEGKYLVNSAYVDINDSWIDKDDVLSCMGDNEVYSEEIYATDVYRYYGAYQINGEKDKIMDREEVVEYLKSHGIKLEGE